MTSRSLMTLLHISDLHIGDLRPDSWDNVLDAEALDWWKATRIYGYLGHTSRALRQLAALYDDLSSTERVHVVITGDLTTTGSAAQYFTARTYLEDALRDPRTNTSLGLAIKRRGGTYSIVPGNHDHWPGRRCTLAAWPFCMLGRRLLPSRRLSQIGQSIRFALTFVPDVNFSSPESIPTKMSSL